jgi:hypothetical protein
LPEGFDNEDRIMTPSVVEEFLTLEQLASRLGYEPKTVQNKMAAGIFKRGIHYSSAPGLPILFRWQAIIVMYSWTSESKLAASDCDSSETRPGQMARKYVVGE